MGNAEILVGLREVIDGAGQYGSIYFEIDAEDEFQDFMNELCSISSSITECWTRDSQSNWQRSDYGATRLEDIIFEYDASYGRIYWGERHDYSNDIDIIHIRDLYGSQCDVCDSQYDIGFLL